MFFKRFNNILSVYKQYGGTPEQDTVLVNVRLMEVALKLAWANVKETQLETVRKKHKINIYQFQLL